MRSLIAILFSCVAAVLTVAEEATETKPAAIVVTDGKSFDAALAAAKDRLVVVDVWAPWCTSCKKLSAELDHLLTTYAGKLTVLRFNSDQATDLKKRFEVGDSLPLLIKFEKGKETAREVGYVNREVLTRWLGLGK